MLLKIGGGFLMAILILICLGVFTGNLGRPIEYRISPEYKGWIVVAYARPSCLPLSHDGAYVVISVPSSGRACTSSPVPQGWRYVRYEYVYDDGRRKNLRDRGWNNNSEIWALSEDPKQKLQFLFSGSQEDLRKSWGSAPYKVHSDQ